MSNDIKVSLTIILEKSKCVRHTNITKTAYDYMTSDEKPYWEKERDWKHMSKAQRLKSHMVRACADARGVEFNYEIIND